MKPLISTNWLENNINKVRLIDCTWHMPSSKRNAHQEFINSHIKGASFFDLEKNSDQNSNLPHMLPTERMWEKIVSKFGIKNSDHVIIYDNSDLLTACRCWYTFLYFGHDPNLVSVLDGGLKKWKKENKSLTKEIQVFPKTDYKAKEKKKLVFTKTEIDKNIEEKLYEIIDARSEKRFKGVDPEPRKNVRPGNIKHSKNLPFNLCINQEDNTFKSKEELIEIFKNISPDIKKNKVFTCGSGVTACILGLANSIISGKTPKIYDGSWSEYGLK